MADDTPILSFTAARKELQKGDILLGHRRKYTGALDHFRVRFLDAAQGTPFGHAAIYLGNNTVAQSSGTKTERIPIRAFENKYDYQIHRPEVAAKLKSEAAAFAAQAVDRGYTYLDAVRGWLSGTTRTSVKERMKARELDTLHCGSLVAAAYAPVDFGKHPKHVLPVDFAKSPHTALIATAKEKTAMTSRAMSSFAEELEKTALLERLVRLGATDVGGPRMLMRHRSPEELAQLQHGVTAAFDRFQAPAKRMADKALDSLPARKLQPFVHAGGQALASMTGVPTPHFGTEASALREYGRAGAHTLIENPHLIPIWAKGVPGTLEAGVGTKLLAEKAIDRFAPLPKVASLDKEAVNPLGMGVLGHFGVNALNQASRKGSNLSSWLAHRGLQHGLTGSEMAPMAQRSIRAMAGPEALEAYDVAHALGKSVQHLPTPEQHARFSTVMGTVGQNAAIDHVHDAAAIREAVQHELHGTQPTLQSKGLAAGIFSKAVSTLGRPTNTPFSTPTQRVANGVLGAAPLAAAAALDPAGAAVHVGLNTGREIGARSAVGKRGMESLFQQGLGGRALHPAVEHAVNYAVSPAVLDPMRAGQAARGSMPASMRPSMATATDPALLAQAKQHFGSLFPSQTPAPKLAFSSFVGEIEKLAAGAPTRGGFMMASDIPAFNAPQLSVGIQKNSGLDEHPDNHETESQGEKGKEKDGDALPNFTTYSPGDFRPANLNAKHAQQDYYEAAGALIDKTIPFLQPKKAIIPEIQNALARATGGTEWSHQQVAIPKHLMDLEALGFKKTRMAIPLPGESWGTPSYRAGKLHAHEAGPVYLIHEDADTPGLRHMIEDVPGALKRRFFGSIEPFVKEHTKEKDADLSLAFDPAPGRKQAMAMTTPELAVFVAQMRKEAIAGLTPMGQLEKSNHIGAPKASAPPGPSIADIAKPKGPKFGIGIPGAFKTGIG